MPIIVGISGFLLLFAADALAVAAPKPRSGTPWRRIPSLLRMVGYLLVSAPLLGVAAGLIPRLHPEAPLWLWPRGTGISWVTFARLAMWLMAALSFGMLVWTVFFEIEAIRKKKGLPDDALISEGSYGRCRHPGFWWFTSLALCLMVLEPFDNYIVTLFVMILLDLILVWVQDYLFFPRLFKGYDAYKKAVPFLIPRKMWLRPT